MLDPSYITYLLLMAQESYTMSTHNSSTTNIRKATLNDAQAITKLGSHVFTVTLGPDFPATDLKIYLEENYSIEATAKELKDPDKDMLVATSPSDQILGFALMTRGPPEPCICDVPKQVQLQRLYIHPDAQGQGVGKALITRVEAEARKQGFENLWLGVYEKNYKAIGIYEKLGFKRVETHEFITGEEVQMDLVMLKSL
jgi:ribosomal protein S18 acetylase RimI-like enzyme